MTDYAALDDESLLGLLRTEEDRLPRAAVDALLARLPRVKGPLAAILDDDALWDSETREWWALVHATYILAAGGDPDSIEPLISALKRSLGEADIDWIFDPSAALFVKFGAPAARRLIAFLEHEADDENWHFFVHAAAAVAHPDDDLSRALLRIAARKTRQLDLDHPGDRVVLETFLDFVRAGKRGLVEEALAELSPKQRGQADAWLLLWEKRLDEHQVIAPFHDSKRDLLKFYGPSAIREREERWAEEAAEAEDVADADLQPAPPPVRLAAKVGRNDPCPCGSGKKFKKCCEGKASSPTPPQGPASRVVGPGG